MAFDSADRPLCLYGHTHLPEVTRHRSIWILNPGSPTDRRRAPQHSLIVLDVAETRLNARLVTIA